MRGRDLLHYRRKAAVTQEELAVRIGVHADTIRAIERETIPVEEQMEALLRAAIDELGQDRVVA